MSQIVSLDWFFVDPSTHKDVLILQVANRCIDSCLKQLWSFLLYEFRLTDVFEVATYIGLVLDKKQISIIAPNRQVHPTLINFEVLFLFNNLFWTLQHFQYSVCTFDWKIDARPGLDCNLDSTDCLIVHPLVESLKNYHLVAFQKTKNCLRRAKRMQNLCLKTF